MPRLIDCATDATADLADLVDACRSPAFDEGSPDGLAAVAPVLRALGNNRAFLADFALDALKENCRGQLAANSYSPQVLLLHPPEGHFFLRANIWPSAADPALRASGPASFFYRMPHDHSFDFLTLGYLGPGYWSDYYEVEPGGVTGLPGEAVDLRFIERSQLTPGRMLLYRANRDVHDQMPPESLSVSINVMPLAPGQAARRQYLFDVAARRIVQGMTATGAELLLRLGVALDAGNSQDLAQAFMREHPDPRMRLAAWSALDDALEAPDARAGWAEAALRTDCPHLARVARRSLDRIRSGDDRPPDCRDRV